MIRKSRMSGGERASEKIKREILRQIQTGSLRVGQWLPAERTLAEQFGVSRVVIREAISVLNGEGIVVSKPGCRPVVARTTPRLSQPSEFGETVLTFFSEGEDGLRTMVETRLFLEKALVRYAAEEARKEDLEKLRDALDRNRKAIGQRGAFEETDADFHQLLYTIPGNPVYPAIHRLYRSTLWGYWGKIERGEEIDQVDYRGHEAIFQAIVARDSAAAEQALQRHLIVAWELIQGILMFRPPKNEADASVSRGNKRA